MSTATHSPPTPDELRQALERDWDPPAPSLDNPCDGIGMAITRLSDAVEHLWADLRPSEAAEL